MPCQADDDIDGDDDYVDVYGDDGCHDGDIFDERYGKLGNTKIRIRLETLNCYEQTSP